MLLMRDLMTREVVTLEPGASVAEALTLCQERRIRHIPILENGRLAGMVSDRDLRDASPALGDPSRDEVVSKTEVGEVMTREVVTAHPQDPVEYAAGEMDERKIDALPVVSDSPSDIEGSVPGEQGLLGIVTSTDVMRALLLMAGAHRSGCRIEVQAPDRKGILAEIATEIRELDVDVVSVLSSPQRRSGYRAMVFWLEIADPSMVLEALQMAGYSASWIPHPIRPGNRS